jgi:hypothetical protein
MSEDRAGTSDVPEGFIRQGRSSPFLAPFEPIWEKPFAEDTPRGKVRGVIVALRLDTPHLNRLTAKCRHRPRRIALRWHACFGSCLR